MSALASMSDKSIAKVFELETAVRNLPQVNIQTDHLLHAGMYHRTILIPAATVLVGVVIKIATTVILSGDATLYIDGAPTRFEGYHILPGGPNRKQSFLTHEDTVVTMIFPTDAKTVKEAEEEFTDYTDDLGSRCSDFNQITVKEV